MANDSFVGDGLVDTPYRIALKRIEELEAERDLRLAQLDTHIHALLKVEAERDALRGLLREARESVSELVNWRDDDPEILARIDAALAGEKQ